MNDTFTQQVNDVIHYFSSCSPTRNVFTVERNGHRGWKKVKAWP